MNSLEFENIFQFSSIDSSSTDLTLDLFDKEKDKKLLNTVDAYGTTYYIGLLSLLLSKVMSFNLEKSNKLLWLILNYFFTLTLIKKLFLTNIITHILLQMKININ